MNIVRTGVSAARSGLNTMRTGMNDKNTPYDEEVISYGITICNNDYCDDILYNNICNDYKSK